MRSDFRADVVAMLPRLRAAALAWTRDPAAADDLVQDTVVRALAAQDQFTPGTNLSAWLYRIQRNCFVSGWRQRQGRGETATLEDAPEWACAVPAVAEERLALRELPQALRRLPRRQREAWILVAAREVSHEGAAAAMGCPEGTVKSLVHRARWLLWASLMGDDGHGRVPRRGRAPPWRGPSRQDWESGRVGRRARAARERGGEAARHPSAA